MKKVKIGLVGIGDHLLQSHFAHLINYEDVEVIGAFDPNLAAFNRIEQEFQLAIQRYETLNELFDNVDAVIIGSPDRFHTEQLRSAVEAGKHVLCEKPMASDLKYFGILKNCFEQAEAKNLVVTSCHPRRFDPPYVWVKQNITELIEKYGPVNNISLDFTYHHPSEEKKNLHGGSMLADHANHEIDYVNFLVGIVPTKAYKLLDEFDRYEMSGIRQDGITFHFKGTRRLEARNFYETIEIRFDRATLHINTVGKGQAADNLSYLHEHETNQYFYYPNSLFKTDYNLRFDGINRNFIDSILGTNSNYLTAREMEINSMLSVMMATNEKFEF